MLPFSTDLMQVRTCPFTGLTLHGRATFNPIATAPAMVLYEFPPIGSAVVGFVPLIAWAGAVEGRVANPRYDLAGLCRAAATQGHEPFRITQEIYSNPPSDIPTDFDQKAEHLVKMLYEGGSNKHKAIDLDIHKDFPLAFAHGPEEFYQILEHVISEGLVRFNHPNDNPNEWVNGMRTDYYGVLLTPDGKKEAIRLLRQSEVMESATPLVAPLDTSPVVTTSTPALAFLHPQVQRVAGSLFESGHYRQAVLESYIALIQEVKQKSRRLDLDGAPLMDTVFSLRNPILRVADDANEQQGFMMLFKGAVMGIRNPKAHAITQQLDPQRAFEWLAFASVLFRKLEEATLTISDAN